MMICVCLVGSSGKITHAKDRAIQKSVGNRRFPEAGLSYDSYDHGAIISTRARMMRCRKRSLTRVIRGSASICSNPRSAWAWLLINAHKNPKNINDPYVVLL